MDLDSVHDAIEKVATLPAEASEREMRESATQALMVLYRACAEVKEKANGYPANPISADVWFNGALLGPMAEKLAALLQQQGLFDLEEQAHSLRCMAVLAVQSHYHHIVGPAMIARGECNERMGNIKLAAQIYQAVIGDFEWFVEKWESETEAPTEEDYTSLECLDHAVAHLLELQPNIAQATHLHQLLERCRNILARYQG